MMRRPWIQFFCILSLMLGMTGCEGLVKKLFDRKAEEVKQAAPPPVAPPVVLPPVVVPTPAVQPVPPLSPASPAPQAQVAPAPPSDEAVVTKVNAYIQCINRTGTRTNQSYQRYLSWVNESIGPTCQERQIYGLYNLYDNGIEICQKAVEVGKATPPAMPSLDQSIVELTQTFTELVPLVKKADEYYQQQDYKDDACAKAKQYHPQLIALFKKFQASETQARKELDSLKADLDQKALAQIEKEKGQKLEWQIMKFMGGAKKLSRAIPETPDQTFNKTDYLAAFDQLQKDYDSLTTYAQANAAETSAVTMFSAWEGSAKRFYTEAKFLKRDLADGKQPDPNKLRNVVQEYNSMISWANSMRF